jgi:hypothetical protein
MRIVSLIFLMVPFLSYAQETHLLSDCLSSSLAKEVINYPDLSLSPCGHEFTVEMGMGFHLHIGEKILTAKKKGERYCLKFALPDGVNSLCFVTGKFKAGGMELTPDVISLKIKQTQDTLVVVPKDKKYFLIKTTLAPPVFFITTPENPAFCMLYFLLECKCQTIAAVSYHDAITLYYKDGKRKIKPPPKFTIKDTQDGKKFLVEVEADYVSQEKLRVILYDIKNKSLHAKWLEGKKIAFEFPQTPLSIFYFRVVKAR